MLSRQTSGCEVRVFSHLLHFLHLDLEALDLGVQLLNLAFVRLAEGGHVLLRRVPEHRQMVLVRLLSARSAEATESTS